MAKQQLSPTERDRDLNMMRTPDRWPQWPVLPLKRLSQNHLETAFLYAASIKPIVYLGNVFMIKPGTELEDMCQKSYESFEAIVADDWIVD